jgi:hypothetical protein
MAHKHVYGFRADGMWHMFTSKKRYEQMLEKYSKNRKVVVV